MLLSRGGARLCGGGARAAARAGNNLASWRPAQVQKQSARTLFGGWFGGGSGAGEGASTSTTAAAAVTAPIKSDEEKTDFEAADPAVLSDASTTPAVEAAAQGGAQGGGTEQLLESATSVSSETIAALADLAASADVGVVKELGNWPSDYAIRGIELLTETADVPLWVGIIGSTFLLRSMMLPFSVISMKMTARMSRAKPEMERIQERMKNDPNKDQHDRAQMYAKQMYAILNKHECKPMLQFVFPLMQIPVFTSMFFGLQKLADHDPVAASQGGALWFTDLSAADPYLALPVLTSCIFLGMVEVGADGMSAQSSANQRNFKWVMRSMAFLMIPMTYNLPTSVFVYWTTANSFSLCQTIMFNKVPGVREFLGIPRATTYQKPAAGAKEEDMMGDFFKALSKARSTGSKDAKGPLVSSQDFEHKKQGDHFLASRPNTPVETFTGKPKQQPTEAPSNEAPPASSSRNSRSRRSSKKKKK